MRKHVSNRVTMLGKQIAAEVEPSEPRRRAWMMIGPGENGGVMLVEFELDISVDLEGYLTPEDIRDRTRKDFDTLGEVINDLERRGIDTDLFDAPWKVDYPL